MNEFEKRFNAFIKHKHIQEYIPEKLATVLSDVLGNIVTEAGEDIFDHFHRGLTHTGLVKWFGKEKKNR